MNLFLEINNYCELKCRFCVADNSHLYDPINISYEFVGELVEQYKYEAGNCAFITGGEPLLHPRIFDILNMLRENGYYIYITTNGLHLSSPEFAVQLLGLGVDRLAIPIYGSTPDRHDKMTGVSGSFEQLIAGLDNLFYIRRVHGVQTKVELRLLMAKYTIDDNENIVELIAGRYPDVDYITILGLQLSTRTTTYEHLIEISLSEARESLRKTIDTIWSKGIRASQTGIPLCILGENYARLYGYSEDSEKQDERPAIRLFPHLSVGPYMVNLSQPLFREKTSKSKSDACIQCCYFSKCDGLQGRYVKRYGFSDLKPILSCIC